MNKQEFLNKGRFVEKQFARLLSDPKFASKDQDMLEHWDVKFDVKGLKKIRRSDDIPNENYHWLEIKGVTGHDGWVYGEADYFAFETYSYWVIVYKQTLQEFIKATVVKEYVKKPQLYKLYRRDGRRDILTLVKTIDLCYLSTEIEVKV